MKQGKGVLCMIRKRIVVFVIIAVVAVLGVITGVLWNLSSTSAGKQPTLSSSLSSEQTENERVTFTATVLEVYDRSVLVEPTAGSRELRSADRIDVSLSVRDNVSVPQMKAGDIVEIIYDGMIQETYPAGIPCVYAIYMK